MLFRSGDSVFEAALARVSKMVSTDGKTGNYNHFWLVEREFDDNRTSLITDPPDGRVPPMTPDNQRRMDTQREYYRLHAADGPEDRSLGERCMSGGMPDFRGGFTGIHRSIVQTPGALAVLYDTGQGQAFTRVIPINNTPHAPSHIRQWWGDSRAHWEGTTLVVDVTNFSPKTDFQDRKSTRLNSSH